MCFDDDDDRVPRGQAFMPEILGLFYSRGRNETVCYKLNELVCFKIVSDVDDEDFQGMKCFVSETLGCL